MNNLNYDPHAVLNVSKNATINDIKNAFINLSRTNHPDRGGNPEIFKIIRGSYDYLVKLHTLSDKQESFYHPLSNEKNTTKVYDVNERANNLSKTYVPIREPSPQEPIRKQTNNYNNNSDISKLNKQHFKAPNTSNIDRFLDSSNINMDKFNKTFMDARIENANDHGYGEMMDNSNSSRLDIDVLTKTKGNHFKNQMIVYKKPQELDSNTINCAQLGQTKINDFSSSMNSKGIQYSDYRIAMSNAEKPTGEIVNKTLNSIQNERKMPIPERSQEEINADNQEKRRLEIEEMNRQYRQHQLDQEIFRNNQKMQPIFDRMRK